MGVLRGSFLQTNMSALAHYVPCTHESGCKKMREHLPKKIQDNLVVNVRKEQCLSHERANNVKINFILCGVVFLMCIANVNAAADENLSDNFWESDVGKLQIQYHELTTGTDEENYWRMSRAEMEYSFSFWILCTSDTKKNKETVYLYTTDDKKYSANLTGKYRENYDSNLEFQVKIIDNKEEDFDSDETDTDMWVTIESIAVGLNEHNKRSGTLRYRCVVDRAILTNGFVEYDDDFQAIECHEDRDNISKPDGSISPGRLKLDEEMRELLEKNGFIINKTDVDENYADLPDICVQAKIHEINDGMIDWAIENYDEVVKNDKKTRTKGSPWRRLLEAEERNL